MKSSIDSSPRKTPAKWLASVLVALAGSIILAIFLFIRPDAPAPLAIEIPNEIAPAPKAPASLASSPPTQRPEVFPPPAHAPLPDATQRIRSTIDQLLAMDLKTGKLSRQQVQFVNDSISDLKSVGAEGLTAIRDFLESGTDIAFRKLAGGEKVAYSSLRVALFDILKEIGGPDGLSTSLRVLQNTADPYEVAILARNVEEMAPEQHREEVLQAARESLDFARSGALGNEDVAPLFQVLRTYGDSSIVADLEKALPNWNYYASLALASLNDGQGLPVLVRQLDDPTAVTSGQSHVALQVLTQVSWENPVARDALISRVQTGQITDAAWPAIADTLAGLNYEFGKSLAEGSPLQKTPNLPKYQAGDQILFSTPTTPSFLQEQIDDRLQVVDQLLGSTQNPAAIDALRKARASLEQKALAAAVP